MLVSLQSLHNGWLGQAQKIIDKLLLNNLIIYSDLGFVFDPCFVTSPYIDSEVNHKRHFIKIPFINKGMEFIDLQSIFNDNLVISSIPNYFNNSETPIICDKYSKPIRSTIFKFNKIVTDIDIDSNTPDS